MNKTDRLPGGRPLYSRIGLLLLFATALWLAPARADEATILEIRPAAGTYQVGQAFEAKIWVVNVVDLYGVDIELGFDAERLAVVDANPSALGIQVTALGDFLYPDFVLFREADNQAGTVHYVVTQFNPRLPATGTGPLFAVTFEVLDTGQTAVDISQHMLANKNAERIPSTAVGASYLLAMETIHRLYVPMVEGNQ